MSSRYNVLPPYCTYMSSMKVILNAFIPIKAAVGSSSAQPPEKLSPLHPVLDEKSHAPEDESHPDDVQTVQLGGDPASLLATKHAKPTALMMHLGATCGTAAHLPKEPKQLHDHRPCALRLSH